MHWPQLRRINTPSPSLRACQPWRRIRTLGLLAALATALAGCSSTAPPRNPENLCAIFQEKKDWHKEALAMEKRWNVPVQVPMAMMYQESSFRHDARPPKKYIMGFIPWGRVSSAYGYSQALDGTWAEYQKSTGHPFASRDDFGDAIDFMGWYVRRTNKINGVPVSDATDVYLNYHEGWGGYKRRSYLKKAWLVPVARKVGARSNNYRAQYDGCKGSLDRGFWGNLMH